MSAPGDPITISLGVDCCCEVVECGCEICGVCQDSGSQLVNITVLAANGNVARYFIEGLSGVSGVGTSGPYSSSNPMEDLSIDYAGQVGTFSLLASCFNDAPCLTFNNTAMTFGDGVTTCAAHSGSTCVSPATGDAVITIGTVVCDVDGFVSVDFDVDLGTDGSFSGTISR